LTDTDIGKIISDHRSRGAIATIGVTTVPDPSQFGVCVTDNNGFITQFQEKPAPGTALSHLANTGIYVFNTKVFDYIPAGTFYGLGRDVLPTMLAAGEPMLAVPSDAYWQDVGNLTIYRQAQKDAIDGKVKVDFPEGATVKDTCVVCAGAIVYGDISEYTVVGADAIVEAGAVVKNSILWDGAIVKAGTYLENSVVGTGVTVSCSHGLFNALAVEAKRPT
jgi:NDP-sugar pyrophosphorylase family protein